tara:strand:- start:211 stop:399 length:189 start_codon:yes stop_codon:yes gene_type:complete
MKTYRILVSEIYGKEIDIKAKTEDEAIKIFEKQGYSDDQVYREKFIESQFCEINEKESKLCT